MSTTAAAAMPPASSSTSPPSTPFAVTGPASPDFDELKYVNQATANAEEAKRIKRQQLKDVQVEKERDARYTGQPLTSKQKERERSRRESAVTRKRTEAYIKSLEMYTVRYAHAELQLQRMHQRVQKLEAVITELRRCGLLPSTLKSEQSAPQFATDPAMGAGAAADAAALSMLADLQQHVGEASSSMPAAPDEDDSRAAGGSVQHRSPSSSNRVLSDSDLWRLDCDDG
ncbi:unnamed protein product [Agarophyton chilense]